MGDAARDEELFRIADDRARALHDPVAQSDVDGIGVFRQLWRGDRDAVREAVTVLDRNVQAGTMHMMRIYLAMPTAWAAAADDLELGLVEAGTSGAHGYDAALHRVRAVRGAAAGAAREGAVTPDPRLSSSVGRPGPVRDC